MYLQGEKLSYSYQNFFCSLLNFVTLLSIIKFLQARVKIIALETHSPGTQRNSMQTMFISIFLKGMFKIPKIIRDNFQIFSKEWKMFLCDKQDHFRLIEYTNTNSRNTIKVGGKVYMNQWTIYLLYGSFEAATLAL